MCEACHGVPYFLCCVEIGWGPWASLLKPVFPASWDVCSGGADGWPSHCPRPPRLGVEPAGGLDRAGAALPTGTVVPSGSHLPCCGGVPQPLVRRGALPGVGPSDLPGGAACAAAHRGPRAAPAAGGASGFGTGADAGGARRGGLELGAPAAGPPGAVQRAVRTELPEHAVGPGSSPRWPTGWRPPPASCPGSGSCTEASRCGISGESGAGWRILQRGSLTRSPF